MVLSLNENDMKQIEYKNAKELGLTIFQESRGFTVMRNAPIVNVRKSHGEKYPQFYDPRLEIAFNKMIKFLTKQNEKSL